MHISGSENVYSAEVEAAAIRVPYERWGKGGHLAMVALRCHALTRETVMAHLDGRLARYKLPRHVTLLDALPRTGSGKVVKDELRALLVAGS